MVLALLNVSNVLQVDTVVVGASGVLLNVTNALFLFPNMLTLVGSLCFMDLLLYPELLLQ